MNRPVRALCAVLLAALALPAQAAEPARGERLRFTVRSRHLGAEREVQVWLPPGARAGRPVPAVYSASAELYFDVAKVPDWLDAQAAQGAPVAALVAVGFPREEGVLGTPAAERFVRFFAEELVPAVEARLPLARTRAARSLLSFSAGANPLVEVAARWPGRFARLAAQSPGWMYRDAQDPERLGEVFFEPALARLARTPARRPLPDCYFVWGDADSAWEGRSREHGQRVVALLRERGARVVTATVAGDHGLALHRDTFPAAWRFAVTGEAQGAGLPAGPGSR